MNKKMDGKKEGIKFNFLDYLVIKYYLLITGFVNIIILVSLLGKNNFLNVSFSDSTKMVLSIATIILALCVVYFPLRISFSNIFNNEDDEK